MKRIAFVVLSVVCLAAISSFGKDAPKTNPFTKSLRAVPAAELPAKAADLVLQAKPSVQEPTTVDVVKSAVGINPAAAPAIVGAIARTVPEMAAVAAGAAAAEQPKQASAIAKAAAAAAPAQAAAIVTAVCRAVPKDYVKIATAVSQAAPGADREIVKAVTTVLPELKPSVEKVLAGYGGSMVSVNATLTQASQVASTTTAGDQVTTTPVRPLYARGPAVGPPYIPRSTTPTNVTSGTAGEVPAGGRNYATP
jgi:hypothetical protein